MNNVGHTGFTYENLMLNFIKNTCIVDFGKIVKVHNNDVIDVQIGAVEKEKDIKVFTCILGSTCSDNWTSKIDPKKGDNVIIFYPKTYHEDMFDPENEETIISDNANGYAFGKGIAFLTNQFFTKAYNLNFLHIADEELNIGVTEKDINIKIGIDEDDDSKCESEASIAKDGGLTYTINDGSNEKSHLSIAKSGEFEYFIEGKLEFSLKEDGNVVVDAKSGKFDFTNSVGSSLGKILGNICDHVKAIVTVGSPATQTLNPASQTNLEKDGVDAGNLLES